MQIAMLGNVISALAAMNFPLQLRLATRFQPIRREGIFTEQRNNSDARAGNADASPIMPHGIQGVDALFDL